MLRLKSQPFAFDRIIPMKYADALAKAPKSDSAFLWWLVDRLVYVYKESPNVDFVLRLKSIAEKLES